MARPKADTVVLHIRVPREIKERLEHHALRHTKGNASVLARKGVTALVQVLDKEETRS